MIIITRRVNTNEISPFLSNLNHFRKLLKKSNKKKYLQRRSKLRTLRQHSYLSIEPAPLCNGVIYGGRKYHVVKSLRSRRNTSK